MSLEEVLGMTEREFLEQDTGCHLRGWDNGPFETGGPPEGMLCELEEGHEGDHAWGRNLDGEGYHTTWEVGE